MKKALIVTTLTLCSLILTPVQAAGDAATGANTFNSRGCVGCHGPAGKKPLGEYPVIGGKPADFLAAELNKFRSGERQSPIMGKNHPGHVAEHYGGHLYIPNGLRRQPILHIAICGAE